MICNQKRILKIIQMSQNSKSILCYLVVFQLLLSCQSPNSEHSDINVFYQTENDIRSSDILMKDNALEYIRDGFMQCDYIKIYDSVYQILNHDGDSSITYYQYPLSDPRKAKKTQLSKSEMDSILTSEKSIQQEILIYFMGKWKDINTRYVFVHDYIFCTVDQCSIEIFDASNGKEIRKSFKYHIYDVMYSSKQQCFFVLYFEDWGKFAYELGEPPSVIKLFKMQLNNEEESEEISLNDLQIIIRDDLIIKYDLHGRANIDTQLIRRGEVVANNINFFILY